MRCGFFEVIDEASGLTKSKQHVGVFWTLNDSGGTPTLYAINAARQLVSVLEVEDATNEDWEALTASDDGYLYIGDFGNNQNERRNLAIYRVPEPKRLLPASQTMSARAEKLPFVYAEQMSFPDNQALNFDAEALFYAPSTDEGRGRLYLLTKHRSDSRTALYRFPRFEANASVRPTLVDSFDVGGEGYWFGGRVTGADLHPSKGLLAILTYHKVLIFEVDRLSPRLDKPQFSVELVSRHTQQVEGIAWDGTTLMLVNEQGDIFSLPENVWRADHATFPTLR